MARKSSNKKINNGEFLVGEKYRATDVIKKEVVGKLDASKGIPLDQLMTGMDMEQMLNAYLDDQNVWTLNINSSFYAVDIPEEVFSYYITTSELHWPTISYNIYGTTRLAWLLMKLNGIKDGNIFNRIPSGKAVRYLNKSKYVDPILAAVGNGEG